MSTSFRFLHCSHGQHGNSNYVDHKAPMAHMMGRNAVARRSTLPRSRSGTRPDEHHGNPSRLLELSFPRTQPRELGRGCPPIITYTIIAIQVNSVKRIHTMRDRERSTDLASTRVGCRAPSLYWPAPLTRIPGRTGIVESPGTPASDGSRGLQSQSVQENSVATDRLAALKRRFHYMRGNLLVLTLTRVLGNFGRRMAFPYASLFLLVLGGDPAQIGVVNALMTFGGLVLLPIAGHISDHASRVKLSSVAQLLSGLVYVLYVLAPRWEYVAVGAVLLGVATLQTPAESALLADSLSPEDRGKGVAAMQALVSMPAMFAPYVGGLVLELLDVELGMRCLYGYLMIAYVASAVVKRRLLRETTSPAGGGIQLRELPRILIDAYRELPTLYRQAPASLRAITGVIVLSIVANAIAGPFWVVYAVERLELSSERWGLILLIEATCLNLVYLPAGEIADRWGRTRCQRAGLVMALLSSCAFVLARGFLGVLASRLCVALAMALFIPATTALIADTVPRAMRGRVMAAIGHGSVLLLSPGGGIGGPGLGFVAILPVIVCSLVAGYLYSWNAAAPWLVLIAIFAVALGLSLRFIRDPTQAEA